MKFDTTINLGHVMTIMAMLLGGAGAYTSIQVDLAELKTIVSGYQGELDDHEDRIRALESLTNSLQAGAL